jgi:hypothetical protein
MPSREKTNGEAIMDAVVATKNFLLELLGVFFIF